MSSKNEPAPNPRLEQKTPPEWLAHVLDNFDDFLVDHAACERKASAVATSMICHYPDKTHLVSEMADLAVEEMIHYRQVLRLIHSREIELQADTKDPYVNQMRQLVRHGREHYFLDRLLVAGIVEARGAERFDLIARHHSEPDIAEFYRRLTDSENRHKDMFVDLALHYCERSEVSKRSAELWYFESEIIRQLPVRAALH